tara:strand:- start:3812 stop:4726 length:915 start_codon:yes stop_codon:yes gene_type:complete
MDFICNLTKSPEDIRDFVFKGNDEKIPESVDYRDQLQNIRNQGDQGTCYAQTAACVKEWQEKQDYGFNEYFSPQFFYNCRENKYDSFSNNDEGMTGRDVMRLLKNTGICSEKNYPYGKIEDKDEIPQEIYNDAKQHLIKGYAKVTSLETLKKSLFRNGPCLGGFPVFNFGSQFWIPNGPFMGGHAVTIVGYNKEGFIIRNSWGENWSDGGYSIYKYEDWGSHWEIWTTIDEKTVLNDSGEKPKEEEDVRVPENEDAQEEEDPSVKDIESDAGDEISDGEISNDEQVVENCCFRFLNTLLIYVKP